MNQVTLIGRVVADPSDRSGVVSFKVVTSESWKDKNTGAFNEKSEFHPIRAFGKTGEYIHKHIAKGQLVAVVGSIHYTQWEDKQTGEKKYGVEIQCDSIKPLSKNPNKAPASGDSAHDASPAPAFGDDEFAGTDFATL